MIEYIFISALFAYGMFTIQRPGFLLDWLRPLWKVLPGGWHEPLFACGVCTSSIWGGLCFLYINFLNLFLIPATIYSFSEIVLHLPVVIVCCAGIQAVLDRVVKACEKVYGYKPPTQDKSRQWEYLQPYEELRTFLVNNFVKKEIELGIFTIEVGGFHREWAELAENKHGYYVWFDKKRPLTKPLDAVLGTIGRYNIIILGLAFEGDLRLLRDAVRYSRHAVIEYSDDGISREQVEKIVEGLSVKLVIPEYEIDVPDNTAPTKCGCSVAKRKLIFIDNQSQTT